MMLLLPCCRALFVTPVNGCRLSRCLTRASWPAFLQSRDFVTSTGSAFAATGASTATSASRGPTRRQAAKAASVRAALRRRAGLASELRTGGIDTVTLDPRSRATGVREGRGGGDWRSATVGGRSGTHAAVLPPPAEPEADDRFLTSSRAAFGAPDPGKKCGKGGGG